MSRELSLPVALATGIFPGFGAHRAPGPVIPTPKEILGADLLGLIDFGDASSISLSSGRVASIVDPESSVAFAQSFSTQRPLHDARGWARFDGNDDCLEYPDGTPYPTGAEPCDIIGVVRQLATADDNGSRYILCWGPGGATIRTIRRYVTGGVSRFSCLTGDGASAVNTPNTAIDFSGVHIVRGHFGATSTIAEIDGVSSSPVSVVPASGASRTRLAANAAGTAGAFGFIDIAAVLVTAPLSPEKWNNLQPWLAAAAARFTA